jgi:hypothetical protein
MAQPMNLPASADATGRALCFRGPEGFGMAGNSPKATTAVSADNRRLHEELEQLLKNARPIESRSFDRAEPSLVIRGK